jgi:hypothetical protein
LFYLCITEAFIEEFASFYSLIFNYHSFYGRIFTPHFFMLTIRCNNLITLSLFILNCRHFSLQLFLSFLPDLLRIAASALLPGWASSILQQLLGTASVSLGTIDCHKVRLLILVAGHQKVPDPCCW